MKTIVMALFRKMIEYFPATFLKKFRYPKRVCYKKITFLSVTMFNS